MGSFIFKWYVGKMLSRAIRVEGSEGRCTTYCDRRATVSESVFCRMCLLL